MTDGLAPTETSDVDPDGYARDPQDRPEDNRLVSPGEEGYDDAFDVCSEPTCPLYGKAVMADHRHLSERVLTCDDCGGTGRTWSCATSGECDPHGCNIDCSTCNGTGTVTAPARRSS